MDRKEIADLIDVYATLLEEELDAIAKLEAAQVESKKMAVTRPSAHTVRYQTHLILVTQLEHDAALATIRRKAHQAYLALVRAWLYSQIKL